jgi:hypothetical protein
MESKSEEKNEIIKEGKNNIEDKKEITKTKNGEDSKKEKDKVVSIKRQFSMKIFCTKSFDYILIVFSIFNEIYL